MPAIDTSHAELLWR